MSNNMEAWGRRGCKGTGMEGCQFWSWDEKAASKRNQTSQLKHRSCEERTWKQTSNRHATLSKCRAEHDGAASSKLYGTVTALPEKAGAKANARPHRNFYFTDECAMTSAKHTSAHTPHRTELYVKLHHLLLEPRPERRGIREGQDFTDSWVTETQH